MVGPGSLPFLPSGAAAEEWDDNLVEELDDGPAEELDDGPAEELGDSPAELADVLRDFAALAFKVDPCLLDLGCLAFFALSSSFFFAASLSSFVSCPPSSYLSPLALSSFSLLVPPEWLHI